MSFPIINGESFVLEFHSPLDTVEFTDLPIPG